MPYHVSSNHADCPGDRHYAVVEDSTNKVMGCHVSSEDADTQLQALYAAEEVEADSAQGLPVWEGVIAVEGTPTGDGRQFGVDALSWGDLPIPLRWNKEDSHGGEPRTVAVNIGRIDKIWRDDSKIFGSGVLNTTDSDGRRVCQMIEDGFLSGISVDVDDVSDADIEFVWPEENTDDSGDADPLSILFASPERVIIHSGRIRAATLCDIPAFIEASVHLTGEYLPADSMTAAATPKHSTATTDSPWDSGQQVKRLDSPLSEEMMNHMFAWFDSDMKNDDDTYPKSAGRFPHHMVGGNGRPGAANMTACSAGIGSLHGARGGTTIPSVDRQNVYSHLAAHLRDGGQEPPEYSGEVTKMSLAATLVAHGAPDWTPPASWFTDPKLSVPTGLTVTDDGRVYGHAAQWGECHVSYPGACVTAPREDSFPYFLTGELVCSDGSLAAVGQITLGTGHAPLSQTAARAAAHYDDTGTAVADVTVGSDGYGLWVAGAVRPDVSSARVRELRASGQLSGDWRRIGGKLRLVGLLAVNVPGFPVPRMSSRVASGRQLALVAAGHISLRPKDLEVYYEQRALRTLADRMASRIHRE